MFTPGDAMLDRWGSFVARRAIVVLLASLLVAAGAGVYGAGVFDSLSQGGFDDASAESSRELDREQEVFGNSTADVVALYSSKRLEVSDPRFRQRVTAVLRNLPEGTTTRVVDHWSTRSPDLVSKDGHATQVLISLAGETQDDYLDTYDRL
ncbi:MAG TPA: hypothetical protein VF728_05650, partial [Nocardioides sp.]